MTAIGPETEIENIKERQKDRERVNLYVCVQKESKREEGKD